MEQHSGLETVIGGGNPEQADVHFNASIEFEKNGRRYEAVEELRQAASCGSNPEHMFRLAYLLDLVGEEQEAINIYEELTTRGQPHINAL